MTDCVFVQEISKKTELEKKSPHRDSGYTEWLNQAQST